MLNILEGELYMTAAFAFRMNTTSESNKAFKYQKDIANFSVSFAMKNLVRILLLKLSLERDDTTRWNLGDLPHLWKASSQANIFRINNASLAISTVASGNTGTQERQRLIISDFRYA